MNIYVCSRLKNQQIKKLTMFIQERFKIVFAQDWPPWQCFEPSSKGMFTYDVSKNVGFQTPLALPPSPPQDLLIIYIYMARQAGCWEVPCWVGGTGRIGHGRGGSVSSVRGDTHLNCYCALQTGRMSGYRGDEIRFSKPRGAQAYILDRKMLQCVQIKTISVSFIFEHSCFI